MLLRILLLIVIIVAAWCLVRSALAFVDSVVIRWYWWMIPGWMLGG